MNVYYSMKKEEVSKILIRSQEKESAELTLRVKDILAAVRERGDEALLSYARDFDGVDLSSVLYDPKRIEKESRNIDEKLKKAISAAAKNIETFHASQKPDHRKVEVLDGVTCWQKSFPIESVGLYIPGGTAPLFSTLLMLAIPAKIAGCRSITIATPPRKDGSVEPAVLYCAQLLGIDRIVTSGGAQAIAALAYGTESVSKVDKIFGPGNRYVTEAKQQVNAIGVAIDMPAGPSEVMVVVDSHTPPAFAASDILSQCEHGADSQAVLVVVAESREDGEAVVQSVLSEIGKQLSLLSRNHLTEKSLARSFAVVAYSESEAADIINEYAPEHLILSTRDFTYFEEHVVNAGSVFLGLFSPESAGDYASGTNHTLPTSGYARAYSGVNLASFMKTITYQYLTPEGLKSLGETVVTMAEAESLEAHAKAVSIRINTIGG